mmetsp:Transcript_24608/g.39495  ORF Transcript_24608/g.39495 Transcript_24608/m.39495 type:complete len:319 (+) Transcript_24608:707-1663(+)
MMGLVLSAFFFGVFLPFVAALPPLCPFASALLAACDFSASSSCFFTFLALRARRSCMRFSFAASFAASSSCFFFLASSAAFFSSSFFTRRISTFAFASFLLLSSRAFSLASFSFFFASSSSLCLASNASISFFFAASSLSFSFFIFRYSAIFFFCSSSFIFFIFSSCSFFFRSSSAFCCLYFLIFSLRFLRITACFFCSSSFFSSSCCWKWSASTGMEAMPLIPEAHGRQETAAGRACETTRQSEGLGAFEPAQVQEVSLILIRPRGGVVVVCIVLIFGASTRQGCHARSWGEEEEDLWCLQAASWQEGAEEDKEHGA